MRGEIGSRYGRLTVLEEARPIIRAYPGRKEHRDRRVKCHCDCGNEVEASVGHLRSGRTASCGCLRKEEATKAFVVHGESGIASEYRAWKGMKARCADAKRPDYKNYGGRGGEQRRNQRVVAKCA